MGLLWGFPILLLICTSHHCHPTAPGLDLGAYFHEISRLWKVGNERFFPGEKEGYALCLFEAPASTWGSTCVLGSQCILGGTFRYMWERDRNNFLISQTA